MVRVRRAGHLLRGVIVVTASAGVVLGVSASGAQGAVEVTYMNDGHTATDCAGHRSGDLHYVVAMPPTAGPHPIVFGMTGTAFTGSADCDPGSRLPLYRNLDTIMGAWAAAGYVAVNIEYHGFRNGLYGDDSYPGAGRWGAFADGTVERNIKPAVEYFLSHDPGQYGADPARGLVAFGVSSGGHNAHMLAITGVPGYRFLAAIGWSALPDAEESGSYIEPVFLQYMRTTRGTDLEHFADPMHRVNAGSPAQYIANGLNEFISPANSAAYAQLCRQLRVATWLRIAGTSAHAADYASYMFTGVAPEQSAPAAGVGLTVTGDSIAFAEQLRR